MVREFVELLWPMQPIVAALQLGPEQERVVPGVHGEAGKEEAVTLWASGAEYGCDSVVIALVVQRIAEIADKIGILFGKGVRISEGANAHPEVIFDRFF